MEFRKKTTAILIAVLMISAFAVAAYAVEGTHLVAEGTQGNEATIVIDMPAGFTLGELTSISWEEYLVAGYPPHVDVYLDAGDELVFEYACNNEMTGTGDGAYGAETDAWYPTFNDNEDGLSQIDNTAKGWANSGPPGGEEQVLFTLAEWKAGQTYTTGATYTIDSESIVTKLEIEVDNWIEHPTETYYSEAYVRNIKVNGESATNLQVEVVPPIVRISVTPATVDFGTIISGRDSSPETVIVTNIGNVDVTVTADIDDTFYQTYLKIDGDPYSSGWVLDLITLESPAYEDYVLQLFAVEGVGSHDATLVFWAEEPV